MLCNAITRTRKAKIAIAWFFFVTGGTLGNWASLLPFVKDEQNIGNGELGLILLAAIGGALIALPIVTYCNNKYGSGYSTMGSGVIMMLFFPLVGIKSGVGVFTLAVCMLGFVLGCLDVSVNGQAVLCEKITKEPTLGLFHCVYSIGSFTGAIVGGVFMSQPHSSVLKEVIFFGLVLLLPGLLLSQWLYSPQEERQLVDLHNAVHEASISASSLSNPLLGSTESSTDSYFHQQEEGQLTEHTSSNMNMKNSEKSGLLQHNLNSSLENGNAPQQQEEEAGEGAGACWGSYAKYFILAQIALLTFLAFFGEGSINDWSVIYFSDELNTSPFVR